MSSEFVQGSFRDPDGHVFVHDGIVFRQVNVFVAHILFPVTFGYKIFMSLTSLDIA